MRTISATFTTVVTLVILEISNGFVVRSVRSLQLSFPHESRVAVWERFASSKVENLLTEEFATKLAEDVKEQIEIPFIPDPLVLFMLTQAIEKMSNELSRDTLNKLDEMMDAEHTVTEYDDMSAADRDALADQLAKELNPKIDVPMFNEEQELQALQQIMRVILRVMTESGQERKEVSVEMEVEMARDLLQSKSSRKKLVETLNKAVDIPLLDESQEEALLEMAVNNAADTLESILPDQLLDTLKGSTPDGIAEMKTYLIETVTEKVPVAGLGKEQERSLIETLVDILIDTYVDDTEAEFLLMTEKEQEQELLDRVVVLERELELAKSRYQREEDSICAKIDRLHARLTESGGSSRTRVGK